MRLLQATVPHKVRLGVSSESLCFISQPPLAATRKHCVEQLRRNCGRAHRPLTVRLLCPRQDARTAGARRATGAALTSMDSGPSVPLTLRRVGIDRSCGNICNVLLLLDSTVLSCYVILTALASGVYADSYLL